MIELNIRNGQLLAKALKLTECFENGLPHPQFGQRILQSEFDRFARIPKRPFSFPDCLIHRFCKTLRSEGAPIGGVRVANEIYFRPATALRCDQRTIGTLFCIKISDRKIQHIPGNGQVRGEAVFLG